VTADDLGGHWPTSCARPGADPSAFFCCLFSTLLHPLDLVAIPSHAVWDWRLLTTFSGCDGVVLRIDEVEEV
jgi:hypothetical protein